MSYEEIKEYEEKTKLEIYEDLEDVKNQLKCRDNHIYRIHKFLYEKKLIEIHPDSGIILFINTDDFEERLQNMINNGNVVEKAIPIEYNVEFEIDDKMDDKMIKYIKEEIIPIIDEKMGK